MGPSGPSSARMAWGSVEGVVLRVGVTGVMVAGGRLFIPLGAAAWASPRKC